MWRSKVSPMYFLLMSFGMFFLSGFSNDAEFVVFLFLFVRLYTTYISQHPRRISNDTNGFMHCKHAWTRTLGKE